MISHIPRSFTTQNSSIWAPFLLTKQNYRVQIWISHSCSVTPEWMLQLVDYILFKISRFWLLAIMWSATTQNSNSSSKQWEWDNTILQYIILQSTKHRPYLPHILQTYLWRFIHFLMHFSTGLSLPLSKSFTIQDLFSHTRTKKVGGIFIPILWVNDWEQQWKTFANSGRPFWDSQPDWYICTVQY